jgi:hypothetical protein
MKKILVALTIGLLSVSCNKKVEHCNKIWNNDGTIKEIRCCNLKDAEQKEVLDSEGNFSYYEYDCPE